MRIKSAGVLPGSEILAFGNKKLTLNHRKKGLIYHQIHQSENDKNLKTHRRTKVCRCGLPDQIILTFLKAMKMMIAMGNLMFKEGRRDGAILSSKETSHRRKISCLFLCRKPYGLSVRPAPRKEGGANCLCTVANGLCNVRI